MDPTTAPPADPLTVGFWHKVVAGTIDCENTIELAAPPERVLAAFAGDWALWWQGGRTSNIRPNDLGGQTFELNPVMIAGVFAPEVLTVTTAGPRVETDADGREKTVLAATLAGAVDGKTRFEVSARPGGGTVVRSIWDQVKPAGVKGLGPLPHIVADLHLLVEGKAFRHMDAWLTAGG
jgi:hypothetical protein